MELFDERKLIDVINDRTFAFVIESDLHNSRLIRERYSPAVRGF